MDDESWRTSRLVLGAKQFHFISIPPSTRNSFVDRGRLGFGEWGKKKGMLWRSLSNPSSSWRGIRGVMP